MQRKNKIHSGQAGKAIRVDYIIGVPHMILKYEMKASQKKNSDEYAQVSAILPDKSLVVYNTSSKNLVSALKMWRTYPISTTIYRINGNTSALYYDGTVYTDQEEADMAIEEHQEAFEEFQRYMSQVRETSNSKSLRDQDSDLLNALSATGSTQQPTAPPVWPEQQTDTQGPGASWTTYTK